MKKTIKIGVLLIIAISSVLLLSSCEKEDNTGSKASSNPTAGTIDPGQGASNSLLTVTGSGLGGIVSIVFDKDSIPASFNTTFNTDNALLFRIPTDAVPGQQNIVFKNSLGVVFKLPFMVLGLPTIQSVSNYNFTANMEITFTGKNLNDVSKVVIDGSTTELTIVSKTATSLVVKMPATTTFSQFKVDITNAAGTIVTTQEFVSLDNAYKIFTDAYGAGWDNGSWGSGEISAAQFKSGTKSFKAGYGKGGWSADGFANWSPGMDYSPDYKYFSFWVKGADRDLTFYLTADKKSGGDYGNSDKSTPVLVPANVWTYYKLKVSDVKFWQTGTNMQRVGWMIQGPDDADATLYFDDVIFVK
jgi:hypothetical protein